MDCFYFIKTVHLSVIPDLIGNPVLQLCNDVLNAILSKVLYSKIIKKETFHEKDYKKCRTIFCFD